MTKLNFKFDLHIKKIAILVLVVVALFGCTKENGLKNEMEFTEVTLPHFMSYSSLKRGDVLTEVVEARVIAFDENGQEIAGRIRFTFTINCNLSIYKLEITNNIFELTELKPDFLLTGYTTQNAIEAHDYINSTIYGCLAGCNDEERPGWCKVGCWAVEIGRIAIQVGIEILIEELLT